MAAVAGRLKGKAYEFVNIFEYDVLPLSGDWPREFEDTAEREGAGLLCHQRQRIGLTSHPHFLNHHDDPAFGEHWQSISVRRAPSVVLSTLGAQTFWCWEAFEAVAARPEPIPIYLENDMPTLAHHLGFRVRPGVGGHMRPLGEFIPREIDTARAAGTGAVHPVKGGAS